ncbi:Plant UBX domain-containing protein 8 [Nymphaea thermarum]|nr:Plant UBX domain-containing protein 8 [Nymphaea thermarum]
MARPEKDAIEMFMSITGATEAVALQLLEFIDKWWKTLCFSEQPAIPAPQDDFMDVDPVEREPQRLPGPSLFAGSSLNPFSLLDADFVKDFFDGRGTTDFQGRRPLVSEPREVREIPIEFKDAGGQSGPSGTGPTIEDISGSVDLHVPETYGTVTVADDEDDEVQTTTAQVNPAGRNLNANNSSDGAFVDRFPQPSAPQLINITDNDIEEEMLQAAIEASKKEANNVMLSGIVDESAGPQCRQIPPVTEDDDLAWAVSLSLKTAEQEKALREQRGTNGVLEKELLNVPDFEDGTSNADGRRRHIGMSKGTSSRINVEEGSLSNDEAEEQPLVRNRSRRLASRNADTSNEADQLPETPSSTTEPNHVSTHSQDNIDDFRPDEWGGISSEEHDEAVMLEAALFGRIPEGAAYRFGYPSDQGAPIASDSSIPSYTWRVPRPPSPTLTAQRLLREQQDDEYMASLLADQEKELKARQEAERRHLEEAAARQAAIQEEKQQEEEACRKLLEQQELERQLVEKEASLPQEPSSDNELAVTLLVKMPDGSRYGRRFLKSDKLHSLFDFIDVGRVVKPGTYTLVRPYPRRAFSEADKELSLSELGLSSKQEALFLELL